MDHSIYTIRDENFSSDSSDSSTEVAATKNISSNDSASAEEPEEPLRRKRNISKKNVAIFKNEKKAPKAHVCAEDFEKALNVLRNTKYYRQISREKCVTPIHLEKRRQNRVGFPSVCNLLEIARHSLLKKDWKLLAKVLTYAKTITPFEYKAFFVIFLKYAYICLHATSEKQLLDEFLSDVMSCDTIEQKQNVFKMLTRLK